MLRSTNGTNVSSLIFSIGLMAFKADFKSFMIIQNGWRNLTATMNIKITSRFLDNTKTTKSRLLITTSKFQALRRTF